MEDIEDFKDCFFFESGTCGTGACGELYNNENLCCYLCDKEADCKDKCTDYSASEEDCEFDCEGCNYSDGCTDK